MSCMCVFISTLSQPAEPRSSPLLTWLDLVFGFESLPLDVTQVLGSRAREALVGQTHVLLPDGQGAVQTLAGQLEVIHGHLKKQT